MPKYGGAVTPMPHADGLRYLAGGAFDAVRPLVPFDGRVLAFLNALSAELRAAADARQLSDVQSFAFWCRMANLDRLRQEYGDGRKRLGRGMVFHVAPSNVPVNFAYSLAFGLLAGNANIVRAPSRQTVQVDVVCRALNRLLDGSDHAALRSMVAVVRYATHDRAITEQLSAHCDGRVIWGGDRTVQDIRSIPLPARGVEVTFADRYSLCALSAEAVASAPVERLRRLAEAFYNDTYVLDQNACSCPHLVLWVGDDAVAAVARERFWPVLAELVTRRYALEPVQAVDKLTLLLESVLGAAGTPRVRCFGNLVYTVELPSLPADLDGVRGRFGLFHEHVATSLLPLAPAVTTRFQTLTYHGLDKAMLGDFVVENGLAGIDRIVPVGRALDIDLVWDGHDIIGALSRIVDIR